MHELRKKWNKNTQGWFGILVYIALGFIIAFFFNTLMGAFFNTTTPVVSVFSNSMVPTFYEGDMLIVVGVDTGNLKVGDVVVFESNVKNHPIIHRIVEIRDDGIVTKGDNNPSIDRWSDGREVTPFDEIYGKAVLKIPLLGWIRKGFEEYVVVNFVLLRRYIFGF